MKDSSDSTPLVRIMFAISLALIIGLASSHGFAGSEKKKPAATGMMGEPGVQIQVQNLQVIEAMKAEDVELAGRLPP